MSKRQPEPSSGDRAIVNILALLGFLYVAFRLV